MISSFHDLPWDSEFPLAKQQWFADDGSTAGKFAEICTQCERLQQLGPNYGYFPEESKSILVVAHPTMSNKLGLSLPP